jgi:hypothetical protein
MNAAPTLKSETSEQAQMRHIREARELLKPTEVNLHHFPNWLRRALLKEFGCRYRDTSSWGVKEQVFGGACWLDHWGTSTINDRLCFVSEPYNVSMADQIRIDEIAKRIGCRWYLSANSWWFPGWTIRIVIEPAAEVHP